MQALSLFKFLIFFITGVIGFAANSGAQDYPNRPVKIIVGYPSGGASPPDAVARGIGDALSKIFGKPFIVENKLGASGTIATAAVASSPADGYTLLSGEGGSLEIAPNLMKNLPYDPLKDLTPISMVSTTPVIIVTNSKSNIRTIKELIREAKANPGKLNYASAGIGSIHHLVFEAFNAAAGVQLTHVPFKGNSMVFPALLAGDVQVMISIPGSLRPHMGKVNLLGVSSFERFPFAPDVPLISDDLPNFEFAAEGGILAPAGLPPEILTKLSKAIKVAMESPEMQDRFRNLALLLKWTTPEAYKERIAKNLKKYEQIMKASNIQAN